MPLKPTAPLIEKLEGLIKYLEADDRQTQLKSFNIHVITEKLEPKPSDTAVVRRDTGKRILIVHYLSEPTK